MPRFAGPFGAMAALVAASLLGGADLAHGQPSSNEVFTFQARVTQNGTPLDDNAADLVFAIYSASSGGTAIWSEAHSGVVVSNGMLCVVLGETSSLAGAFSSGDRYIAVHAGTTTGDPEIVVPRVRLTAVPYALNAGGGEVLPSTNGGRISVHATETAPNSATGSLIYLLPHKGDLISLYQGGAWRTYEIPGTTLTHNFLGKSAGLYDLFARPSSETAFVLDFEAWATTAVRKSGTGEGIEQLDGIWVRQLGTTDRQRYLGTVYWDGAAISDTPTQRDVWNVDNRASRTGYASVSIAATPKVGSAWGELLNATTNARIHYTLGMDTAIEFAGSYYHDSIFSVSVGWVMIAEDPGLIGLGNAVNDHTISQPGLFGTSSASHALVRPQGRHFSTVIWTQNAGNQLRAWWFNNRIFLKN